MELENLGVIERKILGAMLILADNDNNVTASKLELAHAIGYKSSGGAITYAIKILERDNYLVKLDDRKYKLLV